MRHASKIATYHVMMHWPAMTRVGLIALASTVVVVLQ